MNVLGLGVAVRGQRVETGLGFGVLYVKSPGKGNPRSSVGYSSLGESWDFCLYFGTKWDLRWLGRLEKLPS